MKGLTEKINESKVDVKSVQRTAKDWLLKCESAEEFSSLLHAIVNGLKEAQKDIDNKFYKNDPDGYYDSDLREATEYLGHLLTYISLQIPYENKNSHEWNKQWFHQHTDI